MFSRIESGRIKYVNDDFDASALVKELAAEWEDIMPDDVQQNIVVFREGMTINNDRVRVKYILNQLMSNAVKFTEKGSIILGVVYHLDTDMVEFFVEDTGCGIPKEKQQSTFDLFWKENEFTQGLGLGLNVAQKLSEGMGLSMGVESKVGVGSKYSLYATGWLAKKEE